MRGAGARELDRGLLARRRLKHKGSVRCMRAKACLRHTHLPSPKCEVRERKRRATAAPSTPLGRNNSGRKQLEEPEFENTKSIERLLKKLQATSESK